MSLASLVGILASSLLVLGGPTPTNAGFENDQVGDAPTAWAVPPAFESQGWKATVVKDGDGGRACRLEQEGGAPSTGVVMQSIDAAELRGVWFELSARVRVEGGDGRGAMLWCRIDRESGEPGFFDNMRDRPVASGEWVDVSILGKGDDDAVSISFGLIALAGSVAYLDDVRLVERPGLEGADEGPSPLTGRGLENVTAAARLLGVVRWFHPSDGVVGADWDLVETHVLREVEDAPDAPALAAELERLTAWIAPSVQVWAGGEGDAPAREPVEATGTRVGIVHHGLGSDYEGAESSYVYRSERLRENSDDPDGRLSGVPIETVLDLGGGVWARVPHVLWSEDGRTLPEARGEEPDWLGGRPEGWRPGAGDRASRLAMTARAWNVFRHFYPYWDVVGTRDWAGELPGALAAAAEAADDGALHAAISEMLARAEDGHTWLVGTDRPSGALPFRARWVEGRFVVVAAARGAAARPGDAVLSIGGEPIDQIAQRALARVGASTDAYRGDRAAYTIATQGVESVTSLEIERGGEHETVDVERIGVGDWFALREDRPAQGAEVAPGIVYIDLTGGIGWDAVEPHIERLANAEGVVFDVRGYPGDAATMLMRHCAQEPLRSAIWRIPIYRAPDQRGVEYEERGRWLLGPLEPRITGRVAWLTDERALSYAESCMAIVEAYGLGEIVGSMTAGTNGNVNRIGLPGGWSLSWTGMRVVKHDGQTVHQGVGVAPTVPVEPTIAGIAAGRDEVLERAIEALQTGG